MIEKAKVRDFALFSNALVRSGDIDPQFWILKEYYARYRMSRNRALWHSLIYLAFYHWGSALEAFKRYPEPDIIDKADWVTGEEFTKQRRLFRGSKNYFALTHLNATIVAADGDLAAWMDKLIEPANTKKEAWTLVRNAFEALPYSGPWSSYKWCDITKFIHDFPITAPDIGTKPGATAGPIAGLKSVTGYSWERCADDTKLHWYLYKMLVEDFGVPFQGLDQMESCLCDWQSVLKGNYYIGHDIDRDLAQIANTKQKERLEILAARHRMFDHRLLGELQTFPRWGGIRRNMNVAYRNQRMLVNNFKDVKEIPDALAKLRPGLPRNPRSKYTPALKA